MRPVADPLAVGILVRHGRAPEQFRKGAKPSYFVTLQTERGERTFWGRGLERAIEQSKLKLVPGDEIGVRENNIDPATVTVRSRDDRGNIVSERRYDSPRPHWVAEKRTFFDERAAMAKALRDPRAIRADVVRDHPELGLTIGKCGRRPGVAGQSLTRSERAE